VRRDETGVLCNSVEQLKAVEEEMNRKKFHIWITLHVSGSDEKSISNDRMRIYDVYNCIRDKPGRDLYDILVRNGEWEVLLTPNNNTMYYSPEVHARLEELLGKGAVEAKQLEQ
jgi:DNA polymerase III subunit alpha